MSDKDKQDVIDAVVDSLLLRHKHKQELGAG